MRDWRACYVEAWARMECLDWGYPEDFAGRWWYFLSAHILFLFAIVARWWDDGH